MARPRLFLIDTFGFLFRAFHARARSGAPPMRTSAGLPTEVVFIFNNMLKKLKSAHKPDYWAAIFESQGPTLREQEFKDYKATRAPAPHDFLQQIPSVRRLLDSMRVPVLEYPGYEADDVIGAISRLAPASGVDVVIVSSDKDMLQLVNDRVSMLNPVKDDEWYDPARVRDFMGVAPEQVADLLALKGDSIDNIPGAPGIGDKGARDLIQQFGSLEAVLDRASEVARRTYRESLENNRAQIELSKRLATITTDIPLEWQLDRLTAADPDDIALRQVYTDLEFFSQLKDLKSAPPSLDWKLQALDEETAPHWLAQLRPGQPVAVTLGRSGEGLLAETRLGLSTESGAAVSLAPALARTLLEDPSHPKSAHDSKTLQVELAREGIALAGLADDVMLYEFLLGADPGGCSWEVMSNRHLGRATTSVEEMAAGVFLIAGCLREEVERRELKSVYETIDFPSLSVLARMERHGVRIDPAALKLLSADMVREIDRMSAAIYAEAGHPFNINSPQQLGKILFEELKLPTPTVRGKGKQPSTAADILESLAEHHRIAQLVLEYRQVAKLKNTYVDTLPLLIDGVTGRLHTTFNITGAATGRLSSTNPNLQNIPIRTELGRQIRAAFVPGPGWTLVVADYSQIELRLLAHFSRDPVLLEAFRQGEDIHTRTASEVFGVMPAMVNAEMRRNAKAVNFGIVYGLSSFGLAAQLGIPRTEADRYIRNYFERYAGVKRFIDHTIAEVRRIGITHTLFGRQRPIPDINSRNPNARGFAERTAVNTPLQGTAADVIKLAMIRIDHRLAQERMRARMLLQVHDELVFEAPPEEVSTLAALVKQEMGSVHTLDVPLVVEVGAGPNWRDAK